MSPLGITLLMLASFAGFTWLTARKLRVVAILQPDPRLDDPGARLRTVLVDGFMQDRMIRREWKPGIMHTVIFLGFLSLLLRKLQLIAIGYEETFAFTGLAGGLFAAFKDFVEVAVVLAVSYAFYRRIIVRPPRLEPNREAVLVLSLILTIMVTDFLFDGFRFSLLSERVAGIGHERAYAFGGVAVANLFSGLPPTVLTAGYVLSYWIQMVVVRWPRWRDPSTSSTRPSGCRGWRSTCCPCWRPTASSC